MRALFGVLSLVVVLAIVGMLAKKQLTAARPMPVPVAVPAPDGGLASPGDMPATVKAQSQQMQQQYQKALESAMQPRAEPAEAEKP